jgi:hypothetical protein
MPDNAITIAQHTAPAFAIGMLIPFPTTTLQDAIPGRGRQQLRLELPVHATDDVDSANARRR